MVETANAATAAAERAAIVTGTKAIASICAVLHANSSSQTVLCVPSDTYVRLVAAATAARTGSDWSDAASHGVGRSGM